VKGTAILAHPGIDPPPAAVSREAGEAELVLAARRGNRGAREELARRLRRPAYSLALQLLHNPDDAFDAAQDGLLRLFGSLDRLEPGRPAKPWLLAIVRNRARDLLRRRRVRRAEPLEGTDPDRPRQVIDTTPGPAASAELRELQALVWRALARLPEAQREILVLRDYQDLSYAEIAAVLRVPTGTVMSRLHRARKALRHLLEEVRHDGHV
jgi:RNA polymerase sigma-70 factor (ECF subfamily)